MGEEQKSQALEISLDLIDQPAQAMRQSLTPESVEDLVRSIRQFGVLQPILVRQKDGRFEIIAGHRRFTATKLAGLAKIPCVVANLSADMADIAKIHENIYRADVNPVDEATYLDYLIKTYKLSTQKLAEQIGKSSSYVLDRLSILSYPDELRQALARGQVKITVARVFSRITDPQKLHEYLRYAIASGITPQVAEGWYSDWKRQQRGEFEEPKEQPNSPFIDQYKPTEVTCLICAIDLPMMYARIAYLHDDCLANFKTVMDTPESPPEDKPNIE
jgi:ParB family chromosome partitioning protein